MKCSNWQDLILTDYLDNQMNEEQTTLVEEHLSDCRECREFAANARKAVIEPFENAQRKEPSEVVWQNIKKAISEEQEEGEFVSLWERVKETIFIPKPALAFAAIAIVLVIGVLILGGYNHRLQIAKNAALQDQSDDVDYVLDELAAYSEENNFDEPTGIEEYFL